MIFHLHRYFLSITICPEHPYGQGIISYRKGPTSPPLYPPSCDETHTTPSIRDLQTLPLSAFITIIRTLRVTPNPQTIPFWSRTSSTGSHNVTMLRNRLLYLNLTPELEPRVTIHGLRDGFYVNTVCTLCQHHGMDVLEANRAARFLGDWAPKSDPYRWYDAPGQLNSCIDLTALQRGEKSFFKPTALTVRKVLEKDDEPGIGSNAYFYEQQCKYTYPFVTEVVTVALNAIKASRCPVGVVVGPNRTFRRTKDAVAHAVAYYLYKVTFPHRNIESNEDYRHYLRKFEEMEDRAYVYFYLKAWYSDYQTRQELFEFIEREICRPLLRWEGAPHCVFLQPQR